MNATAETLIDNYRDANGQAIQPYYAAYMIEFGYRTPEEAAEKTGNQVEYMCWNSTRWAEFDALHGFKLDDRCYHRDEFRQWLAARALDHVARNHVEALAA